MSDLATKAAILEVLNGYSGAAARLDIDEYLSFFTPDAEFWGVPELMGLPAPFKGHEQIGGFFGASFKNMEWLQQQNTTTNITIGADGTTATASTSITENAKPAGGDQIYLLARYEDELKLTDAGWKFTKRKLVPHRFAQVP